MLAAESCGSEPVNTCGERAPIDDGRTCYGACRSIDDGVAYIACYDTCRLTELEVRAAWDACDTQFRQSTDNYRSCLIEQARQQQPEAAPEAPQMPKQTPAQIPSAPAPASAPTSAAYAAMAPAKLILSKSDRIELSNVQSTGAETSALQNVKDVAEGKCASTGKSTCQYLSPKLLQTMVTISKKYRYSVSALTGGEHCKSKKQPGCKGISNHYAGQAFDVNYIYDAKGNKTHVSPKDGNSYDFMKACLKAGFTDVIGPNPLPPKAKNNKAHDNHVHCGFK